MLQLCNISKNYGGNQVLKSVNLVVQAGEIHGIVGENGAGKSTLLSILFGRVGSRKSGSYTGEIYLAGQQIDISSPQEALKVGIGMVHQEFALFPEMTVSENINIGQEQLIPYTRKVFGEWLGYIDKTGNRGATKKILENLGVHIDPTLKVVELSIDMQQFVELARVISKEELKVLILDEPTATLGQKNSEQLLAVVRELSQKGIAVVLVSHRLNEMVDLCDNITVLRNGEVVSSYEKEQFDIAHIAKAMVGHSVIEVQRQKQDRPKEVIMQFQDISAQLLTDSVHTINLAIYKSEIIGIIGLPGHGKMTLGNIAMGLCPATGRIMIENKELSLQGRLKVTMEALKRGIYLVPDDRRHSGLLLQHSVADNIIFTALQQKNEFLHSFFCKALSWVDKDKSNSYVMNCITKLDIRCSSSKQKVEFLSGGNQQKVCLAKAMAMKPKILFIHEPTRGIDIGAKEIILEALMELNTTQGTTIIVASSELGELKRVCDRIVVMYEGCIFGIFSPTCDDLEFALAFSGKTVKQEC